MSDIDSSLRWRKGHKSRKFDRPWQARYFHVVVELLGDIPVVIIICRSVVHRLCHTFVEDYVLSHASASSSLAVARSSGNHLSIFETNSRKSLFSSPSSAVIVFSRPGLLGYLTSRRSSFPNSGQQDNVLGLGV